MVPPCGARESPAFTTMSMKSGSLKPTVRALYGGPGERGERRFHLLLHGLELLLPRERVLVDAREDEGKAGLPGAGLVVDLVGRDAEVVLRVLGVHRRPGFVGRLPVVAAKRCGVGDEVLLQRRFVVAEHGRGVLELFGDGLHVVAVRLASTSPP